MSVRSCIYGFNVSVDLHDALKSITHHLSIYKMSQTKIVISTA